MRLNAPEEEPLTLRLLNCTVTPKPGYEDIPVVEGENICEIDLTGTTLSGFLDPRIL